MIQRGRAETHERRRLSAWLSGLIVAAVVVVAGGAVWFFATGRQAGGISSLWGGSAIKPSVLFITVDTLRADRLGCYGYAAARTPTIDALAASGVRFEEAYSQVPLTLPSHVSLFSGLYPVSTGVQINGAVALGPAVPTLAELFKDREYRTGAFVAAGVLDSAFGLGRGFDVYDDDLGSGEAFGPTVERRADRVCDAALSWLDQAPAEPFFAWVHFFDPHDPYQPPARFAQGAPTRYDGEIAFVDSEVRRLLTWLDDNGLRDRTMVVLAGDHGEGLGDHGEDTHGHFVYDSTVRVPLIVAFPSTLTTPRTIPSPVELVDVFPTLVEVLGWDSSEFELDGKSLARALKSGESPVGSVYGETEYPLLGFGWAPLRYSIVDRWKYIDAPRAELYDRRADPQELDNVIDDYRDVADRMRAELVGLVSALRQNRPDAATASPDAEALERLTGLGYVATAATPEDFDDTETRRDPKDMRDVVRGFKVGMRMYQRNDFAGVIETLVPLVEQSPESAELSTLLGYAYMRLARYQEAQLALEASLRQNSNNFRAWFGLGAAFSAQNRLEESLSCFEETLARSPEWDLAHRDTASVLSRLGRIPEAERHWRRCVELNPQSVQCLTNLGSTLLMLRKPDEAVVVLQRALLHEPANEHAHRSLWQALIATGRRADARRSLEQARELFPEAREFTCPLAWYRATTPDTSPRELRQAIEWSKACCAAEPENPRNFDALAAAYAANGDYANAVDTARRALTLAITSGQQSLQTAIETRLRLYESDRPFVESPD